MCKKANYKSFLDASNKADELNSFNSKIYSFEDFKKNRTLRAYKCDKCEFYHLTSMDKKVFRKKNNLRKLKNQKRESSFIHRESTYWRNKFKLTIK